MCVYIINMKCIYIINMKFYRTYERYYVQFMVISLFWFPDVLESLPFGVEVDNTNL